MKAAAVQMDVKIFAKEQNTDQILRRLEEAADAGAKLAVFPECALSGYCFDSLAEAAPLAEEVPGPSTEKLLAGEIWLAGWRHCHPSHVQREVRVQLTCTRYGYRGRAVWVLRHLGFSRLL